jgi:hypothetical protein
VLLDQPRQEPFAEEPRQDLAVPTIQRPKGIVFGEAAVGHQQVAMAMPLEEIDTTMPGRTPSPIGPIEVENLRL